MAIHCKEFKTCSNAGEHHIYMGLGKRPLLPMCQVCDNYDPVDFPEVIERNPVIYPFKSNSTEIQLRTRLINLEKALYSLSKLVNEKGRWGVGGEEGRGKIVDLSQQNPDKPSVRSSY